jgi:hypothetical protein
VTVRDEFWQSYRMSREGCWEWTRARTKFGYGHLVWNGRHLTAHRQAWEFAKGAIPAGMCVLHRCDNPACINPDHLWLGTKSDNTLDCSRKGRRYAPKKEEMRRGEAHGIAKLCEWEVLAAREWYGAGLATMPELARLHSDDQQYRQW